MVGLIPWLGTWGFSSDTWKMGCILRSVGNVSCTAAFPISFFIGKGPRNKRSKFFTRDL